MHLRKLKILTSQQKRPSWGKPPWLTTWRKPASLEYLSKFGKYFFCHLLGNTVNQTDGSNDNSNANMLLLKLQFAPPAATQDEENEIFNYLSVEGRAEVLKNFKGLGIQQLSPWTWNDFYGGRWDASRSLSKYFPRKKRGRFGNKAKNPSNPKTTNDF